jgi:hypothetical protein
MVTLVNMFARMSIPSTPGDPLVNMVMRATDGSTRRDTPPTNHGKNIPGSVDMPAQNLKVNMRSGRNITRKIMNTRLADMPPADHTEVHPPLQRPIPDGGQICPRLRIGPKGNGPVVMATSPITSLVIDISPRRPSLKVPKARVKVNPPPVREKG